MLNRRILIIFSAVAGLVLIVSIIAFAASNRKLTLRSDPDIDSIRINDKTLDFHQGMQVDFNRTLIINVGKDGYEFFSATLDPGKDKTDNFTIKLIKKSSTDNQSSSTTSSQPDTPNNNLLQAATGSDNETGLTSLGQLNVRILDSKGFSGGYVVDTIQPLDASGGDGTAIVVLLKDNSGSHIILGPGTAFGANDLEAVSGEVANYLRSIGAVGE